MSDIYDVVLTKRAERNLEKVPKHIVRKLQSWIDSVEYSGLNAVKNISGYHNEPLKGERLGQWSIRLSKAYRAIYVIHQNDNVEIIKIMEVNKHDY